MTRPSSSPIFFLTLFSFLYFSSLKNEVFGQNDLSVLDLSRGETLEGSKAWRKAKQIEVCEIYKITSDNKKKPVITHNYNSEGLLTSTTKHYPTLAGKYAPLDPPILEYQYDNEGKIIKGVGKNKNGKIITDLEYVYTEDSIGISLTCNYKKAKKGNVVKKIEEKRDNNGTLIQKIECSKIATGPMDYGAFGKNMREKDCWNSYYEYDDKGKLIQITLSGGSMWVPFIGTGIASNKVRSASLFMYDSSSGKLSSVREVSNTGTLKRQINYSYIEDSLVEKVVIIPGVGIKNTYKYEYNEDDVIVKILTYKKSDQLQYTTYFDYK